MTTQTQPADFTSLTNEIIKKGVDHPTDETAYLVCTVFKNDLLFEKITDFYSDACNTDMHAYSSGNQVAASNCAVLACIAHLNEILNQHASACLNTNVASAMIKSSKVLDWKNRVLFFTKIMTLSKVFLVDFWENHRSRDLCLSYGFIFHQRMLTAFNHNTRAMFLRYYRHDVQTQTAFRSLPKKTHDIVRAQLLHFHKCIDQKKECGINLRKNIESKLLFVRSDGEDNAVEVTRISDDYGSMVTHRFPVNFLLCDSIKSNVKNLHTLFRSKLFSDLDDCSDLARSGCSEDEDSGVRTGGVPRVNVYSPAIMKLASRFISKVYSKTKYTLLQPHVVEFKPYHAKSICQLIPDASCVTSLMLMADSLVESDNYTLLLHLSPHAFSYLLVGVCRSYPDLDKSHPVVELARRVFTKYAELNYYFAFHTFFKISGNSLPVLSKVPKSHSLVALFNVCAINAVVKRYSLTAQSTGPEQAMHGIRRCLCAFKDVSRTEAIVPPLCKKQWKIKVVAPMIIEYITAETPRFAKAADVFFYACTIFSLYTTWEVYHNRVESPGVKDGIIAKFDEIMPLLTGEIDAQSRAIFGGADVLPVFVFFAPGLPCSVSFYVHAKTHQSAGWFREGFLSYLPRCGWGLFVRFCVLTGKEEHLKKFFLRSPNDADRPFNSDLHPHLAHWERLSWLCIDAVRESASMDSHLRVLGVTDRTRDTKHDYLWAMVFTFILRGIFNCIGHNITRVLRVHNVSSLDLVVGFVLENAHIRRCFAHAMRNFEVHPHLSITRLALWPIALFDTSPDEDIGIIVPAQLCVEKLNFGELVDILRFWKVTVFDHHSTRKKGSSDFTINSTRLIIEVVFRCRHQDSCMYYIENNRHLLMMKELIDALDENAFLRVPPDSFLNFAMQLDDEHYKRFRKAVQATVEANPGVIEKYEKRIDSPIKKTVKTHWKEMQDKGLIAGRCLNQTGKTKPPSKPEKTKKRKRSQDSDEEYQPSKKKCKTDAH